MLYDFFIYSILKVVTIHLDSLFCYNILPVFNTFFGNLDFYSPVKLISSNFILDLRDFFFKKRVFYRSSFYIRRVYFLRYLNNFIFGFVSSKFFAYKFKRRLFAFLKGNLFLNRCACDLVFISEIVFNKSYFGLNFCGY